MTAEVAALHVSEDNVSEETATAKTVMMLKARHTIQKPQIALRNALHRAIPSSPPSNRLQDLTSGDSLV
jgi:hypothetical protein